MKAVLRWSLRVLLLVAAVAVGLVVLLLTPAFSWLGALLTRLALWLVDLVVGLLMLLLQVLLLWLAWKVGEKLTPH